MAKIWRNLKENRQLINEAAKADSFIVFDTETTGLHPENGDQIVEFAAMRCRYSRSKGGFFPIEQIDLFIKPDKPISEEASKVNGITMEMLEGKPDEREAYRTIKEFLGDRPALGAYNSGFDIRMLSAMYGRNGDIFTPGLDVDFLKIAKDIFCSEKLPNHKLGTIADTYGVTEGIRFHSAIDDVRVLVRVINKMITDLAENGVSKYRKPVSLYSLSYYEGFRGNSRLYCITSEGPIYYEFLYDKWSSKGDCVELEDIDMNSLEEQVFEKTGRKDYRTLRNDLAAHRLILR